MNEVVQLMKMIAAIVRWLKIKGERPVSWLQFFTIPGNWLIADEVGRGSSWPLPCDINLDSQSLLNESGHIN